MVCKFIDEFRIFNKTARNRPLRLMGVYTVSQKTTLTNQRTSTDSLNFGTDVVERVCYQMALL